LPSKSRPVPVYGGANIAYSTHGAVAPLLKQTVSWLANYFSRTQVISGEFCWH